PPSSPPFPSTTLFRSTRKRRDVLGALEHNALRHALRAQLLMCDFADLDRIAAAAGSLALALERLGGGAQLRELLQPLARRGFAERHRKGEQWLRAGKHRDQRPSGPPQSARALADLLGRDHALAATA